MANRNRRARHGAAATELALLLPFLGLMFVAALDFGRVFNVTQTIEECAFVGAVYASGNAQSSSATSQDQAATNAACASGVSLTPPVQAGNVTVTRDAAAQTVTVTVTYTFQLLTPVLGPNGQVQLTRTVTLPQAPTPWK
jgi:Flp pilus assembly protein TadG